MQQFHSSPANITTTRHATKKSGAVRNQQASTQQSSRVRPVRPHISSAGIALVVVLRGRRVIPRLLNGKLLANIAVLQYPHRASMSQRTGSHVSGIAYHALQICETARIGNRRERVSDPLLHPTRRRATDTCVNCFMMAALLDLRHTTTHTPVERSKPINSARAINLVGFGIGPGFKPGTA